MTEKDGFSNLTQSPAQRRGTSKPILGDIMQLRSLYLPSEGKIALDTNFLEDLFIGAASQRQTMPPWYDGRSLMFPKTQPYTKEGAYELLLDVPQTYTAHFEFSRLNPLGEFYCRSAMREDVQQRRFQPEASLKFYADYAIARVAETFLTGASALTRTNDSQGRAVLPNWPDGPDSLHRRW